MTNTINLDINFDESNIIFVNGLTYEKVKIYYPWLLNAKIKGAIIGEDDYGLVWYFGEWLCGEWIDGTWYSGIFHEGNWNNGNFYSYKLNKFDVINNDLIITGTDNKYSSFFGLWLNGIFNGGVFGVDNNENWMNFEKYTYLNTNYKNIEIPNYKNIYTDEIKKLPTWINGIFNYGIIYDSIWANGIFNSGQINNSKWIDGKFYDGVFNGYSWDDGSWYNGEFIKGKWYNGTFTQLKPEKISRFGSSIIEELSICEWFSGEWKNGEWFSGYQKINNIELSINNGISIWHNGVWRNGVWYGGHFEMGTWFDGIWKDGIFGEYTNTDFMTPTNISEFNENEFSDINFHINTTGGTYSGLTTLSDYWQITNDEYILHSHKLEYTTQFGGWIDTSSNLPGISGSTSNAIIYIRDEFVSSDQNNFLNNWDKAIGYVNSSNVYIPAENNKKSDFTDLLSNDYILEIGGSGLTISSITYLDDEEVIYELSNSAITSTGLTRIEIFNTKTDWDLYTELNSLVDNSVKIYSKEKISYIKGNGDRINEQRSYIDFTNIKNIGGFMGFVCETQPSASFYPKSVKQTSIPTGDIIANIDTEIQININSTNTELLYLNGPDKITEIIYTNSLYYIITSRTITDDVLISGKIVNFESFNLKNNINTKNLVFDGLSFNTANITDVQGIEIKLNKDITIDYNNEFILDVILPFNDLLFNDYTGTLNYNSDEFPSYDPYGPGSYNTFYVIGKKEDSVLDNNMLYGSMWDLWELDDLVEYYPVSDGFNPNYYDVHNIQAIHDNLRVSLLFKLNNITTSELKLSNLKINVYYKSSVFFSPTWESGIFEKGLIIAGTFNNGKMISSLIDYGDFSNIIFGYDNDINRID